MSYGVAVALQTAILERLEADAALSVPVFDAPPVGVLPETFVQIGTEEVRGRSDGSSRGAEHRVTVSVVTTLAGFAEAKAQAVAVSDALDNAPLSLARGQLVGLWFERARARRDGKSGRDRRIDLRFRARVEDN